MDGCMRSVADIPLGTRRHKSVRQVNLSCDFMFPKHWHARLLSIVYKSNFHKTHDVWIRSAAWNTSLQCEIAATSIATMSRDGSVTSTLRHRDVELIERLSDVIDTWNSSSSSKERISLSELIDPNFNHSDYSNLRTAQVQASIETG